MIYGPLFSGVIKPSKPLYYAAEFDTQITNIALDPGSSKPSTSSTAIEPVIVKLTYEGQKIEEEKEDDDDDEGDDDDDEESEAAYEAKEVVICSLIPGQILQANVNIVLERDEQYHFSITGGAYNVHLLGHYISQETDKTPYSSDSDDSEDELDEDELEYDEADSSMRKALGMGGDSDDSDEESDGEDEGRIQEIRDEAELLAEEEKIASAAAKAKAKAASPVAAASKKRPAPADAEDDDASMADADASTVSATAAADGQKLSKSQKKKLAKKMKKADGTPAAAPASAAPAANGAPNGTEEKTKATDEKSKAKEPEKKTEKASEAAPSKGQPVTLPSGLKYLDTKPGSGASAKPGQKVSMRYIGKLASNGKVFDQNTKGAPFKFQLGKGEVIKGWDEGIKGMKVGGERKLTIPANLAYGKRGAPPDIPPNSTLTFEVKMLGIN